MRDFRGLSPRSFDGNGNYSLGLKEQIVFPEIDYDKVDQIRGLDVVICTSARTDDEARALLKGLDFPFSDRDPEKEKEEEAARKAALEAERLAAKEALEEEVGPQDTSPAPEAEGSADEQPADAPKEAASKADKSKGDDNNG